ncbi:MAG: DUF2065 domain-containing protein, partial [Pseudomonadota bacterium]
QCGRSARTCSRAIARVRSPMSDFLTALGLLLIFEGAIYGAFPHVARQIGQFLLTASDDFLRTAGLLSALVGIIIVWLVRAS